ncbi:MAG: hypothetical protein M3A44_15535 [Gammaproteobacteria bacterium]
MDTSRSGDEGKRWIATALVYTGRRNPSWQIEETCAVQLQQIWDDLEPYLGELSRPKALGYGGCTLRAPGGDQWLVYGDAVSRSRGDSVEVRRDPGRRFEKVLLTSAPAKSLPPWTPEQ